MPEGAQIDSAVRYIRLRQYDVIRAALEHLDVTEHALRRAQTELVLGNDPAPALKRAGEELVRMDQALSEWDALGGSS